MAELAFDLTIKRRDLDFAFAGRVPLEGVTAITGPSGSGKTVFLHALAGLNPRARGQIRFDDRLWASRRRRLRPENRRIGFVFGDGQLFPHLTVGENIAYGARCRGVGTSALQSIAEGLKLQDLLPQSPATLSAGQTRRVALARALASDPEILFLDDPLRGLDTDTKAETLALVTQAVAGAGIPALHVTHSADEIARFADRVLRIEDGRLAGWDRPPATLYVTVEGGHAGHVQVALGPVRFTISGHGIPGSARRIALPSDAVFLSQDPPGPSGALAILPAELVEVAPRPSGPNLLLDVAGQRLDWHLDPASSLAGRLPAPGEPIWLSILSAHLR